MKRTIYLGSIFMIFSYGLLNAQAVDKSEIEKEYLTKARENIEKYRKSDASIVLLDNSGKPLKNIQVELNQVSQDFLFGNLAFDLVRSGKEGLYKEEEFKERFKALFNYAILPFYWPSYESTPGKPHWEIAQDVADWCRENGITCKGHPLAWTGPSGTPRWLLKLPPETATDMLKARITENVTGFKGEINIWDVVNEAVNTVTWDQALQDKTNSDAFRYNVTDYSLDETASWVEKCFKWANEANPDGTYILNEFSIFSRPEIRERFFDLVKELQKRNTPVKGIGIQAHEPREMWFSPEEIDKTLDMYSELNLPIHITEYIPQSSGKDITGWRDGKWTEETQAESAVQFYTLAFGHPSVVSINWWGLSDRDIWLKGGGLLDEEYNPKPVYIALQKLIREDWMTKHVQLKTDTQGRINFRGFQGNYNVLVTLPDGSRKTLAIHVRSNEANTWDFTL